MPVVRRVETTAARCVAKLPLKKNPTIRNPSHMEAPMRLRANLTRTPNIDPQRDSIFTKGPSDVLDHATSEIASGSKLGIDATKKIPGEGFKRPWPPLIKMDEAVRKKSDPFFAGIRSYNS